MKRILIGMSVLTLMLSMDCASVLKGTQQEVTFNSNPEEAQVFVDGALMGETPLTLKLKKNAYDNIMVKKEGYATQNLPLEKKFDGIAIINVFWDLSTTDLITGAIYEYKPDQYHFELKEGAVN